MIPSVLPALIVMQQEEKRKREEEEWEFDRLKREAIEHKYRQENAYNYSCSTPSIHGSCSNNGNSFENKS